MQALYTWAPGDYALVERPDPVPALDEALIKVERAAICHTDVIIREGLATHVRYPVIPGHEFAGVVERCGSCVDYLKPGDRVAVHTALNCGHCRACRSGDILACESYAELGSTRDGGFAEFCTVPARHLFRLPENVSTAEGAMLEPLANAVSALREGALAAGERVVVIGPGPIGLLVVQVAKLAYPSHLVLVGTRDERLALGQRLGAFSTVRGDAPDAAEQVRAALGGRHADLIIDCAGTRSALDLAFQVSGWRTRIVIEGTHPADEVMPIAPRTAIQAHAMRLIGVCGWLTGDYARSLDLVTNGQVDVNALVTHTFPLAQWEAAYDMVTKRKSEAIKVLLSF
ncbi:MAG: zinc-dependent alcohol dehydrogenase [Anaerolineae bacterium]